MHHLRRFTEKIRSNEPKNSGISQQTPTYSGQPTSKNIKQAGTIPCYESHAHLIITRSFKREEIAYYLEDANKRVCKKLKGKGCLTQEDTYIIKLKSLNKTLKVQRRQNKQDLNSLRLSIETIMEEIALSVNVELFQNRLKLAKRLRDLSYFLSKLESQKAILLSYELFQTYLMQLNLKEANSHQEVAMACHKMFIPYVKLIEMKDAKWREKSHKKMFQFVTYQQVKKLLQRDDIALILARFPDPIQSSQFQKNFESFLNEKLNFQQAMNVLKLKTRGVLKEPCQELLHKPVSPKTRASLDELDEVVSEIIRPCLENAGSLELDERNNIASLGRQGTYFQEVTNEKGLNREKLPGKNMTKCHNVKSELKEDDSSNEHSQSDQEADKELLNDRDLYIQANNELQPTFLANEKVLTNQKVLKPETEKRTVQFNSTAMRKSQSRSRKGSFMKTSDELQLETDPLRVSKKVEIIRVNSSNDLYGEERKWKELKEEEASPTPSVSQRKLTVSQTKKEILFQKVLGIARDEASKWDYIKREPSLTICKMKTENSPIVLLRVWTLIDNFSPKEVFTQIYDTQSRFKWDTVTCGLRVIERLDETSAVIYFYVKTPFGITERDFVQRRSLARDYPEPGSIVMAFESCTHPSVPVQKRIRAETHIAGYILKPSKTRPGATELCIISQVDIKGIIPKCVVNMVAGKAPIEWIRKLVQACERARKQNMTLNYKK